MCRPVGRIFTPYMSFSNDYGAVTDQQNCVLVLVFSEPVTGLSAAQLKVSGPPTASVTALKLLQGTSSYYHVLVVIATAYTGQVMVTFSVSFAPTHYIINLYPCSWGLASSTIHACS